MTDLAQTETGFTDELTPCTCQPDQCHRLTVGADQCQYCARLGSGEDCPAEPWDLSTPAPIAPPTKSADGGRCGAGCDNGPEGSCWHDEEDDRG